MKRIAWMLVLIIAGCGAARLPIVAPPLPPPVAVAPPVEVVPKPNPDALAPPIKTVAQQYQQAAQKEVAAVTAPDVTPEYIKQVQTADRIARRALSALETDRSPTVAALNRARDAVRDLAAVLDAAPQGGNAE